MRNLMAILVGSLVGLGFVVGIAIVLPGTDGSSTVAPAAARPATVQTSGTAIHTSGTAMRMSGTAMRMSGAMSGMGSGMTGSTSLATRHLTIQHAQKGCHVWSLGTTRAAMLRLHLKPGQKLSVLDQDVDAHQLMQFAGPAHLRLGGPMMNHGMTLAFPKKGVYRLGTKTVEMPGGMQMDVKTIGPDNKLRLVVTVA